MDVLFMYCKLWFTFTNDCSVEGHLPCPVRSPLVAEGAYPSHFHISVQSEEIVQLILMPTNILLQGVQVGKYTDEFTAKIIDQVHT